MRLQVEGLSVTYETEEGSIQALDGIDLRLEPGRALGIVGASGSGKSTFARALMRLMPAHARIDRGRILWGDDDLLAMPEEDFRHRVRWKEIAMIFQGASQPFNPVLRVGDQIIETIRHHRPVSFGDAQRQAAELFERVGLPADRLWSYPHQLSGGMRQRAGIALALCAGPRLLVADEPTSSLDVLVEAQILRLLTELCREQGLSLLLISHDLSVVAQVCDDVAVLQAGRIVESGPVATIFRTPRHPYTRQLVAASFAAPPSPEEGTATSAETAADTAEEEPQEVCAAHDVHKDFAPPETRSLLLRPRQPRLRAVAGVDLRLVRGEVLGLVGESGSGKTTLARLLMGLERPSRGRVVMADRDLSSLSHRELRQHRRRFQMIMQDPNDAMNPRMDVFQVVAEPLRVQESLRDRAQLEARVRSALIAAELSPPGAFLHRPVRTLSGGERQRVAIARALILEPEVLIADEPVAMLDAATRAGVVQLLSRLVHERSLGLLFITHDLVIARRLCDRIAVMYRGRIVEEGPAASVFRRPHHPYTQALFHAVETPFAGASSASRPPVENAPERADEEESGAAAIGCAYAPRCPWVAPRCRAGSPPRVTVGDRHQVACHRWEETAEATPEAQPV